MTDKNRYSSRSVVVIAIVALMLGLVSAPVAAQETESKEVDITVTEDEIIDSQDILWTVTNETYADLDEAAENGGYDSVAKWFETIYDRTPSIGSASVTERELNPGLELDFTLSNVDNSNNDVVNVTVVDGTAVYEQATVEDPADPNTAGEVTYRIVMPGDISETNADVVDGNEATWYLHEEDTSDLYVESSLEESTDDVDADDEEETADATDDAMEDPTTDADDDSTNDAEENNSTDDAEEDGESDQDAENDDDSLPGFGAVVAVVAVVGSMIAVGRRTDRP